MGLEPVAATNLSSRRGLFAGSDDERLDAFHSLVGDDSLGAVFFARGGHGLLRVLPRIDWSLLARRPRFYVGYSDLTPFLLQVVERLGLVAVHGPMVAADLARGLDDVEEEWLRALLACELPREIAVRPCGGHGRVVEGRLVGGCLSMLCATLGTPFAPDLDDGILFLEDVGEPLYRIDRMLTHLRLSGNLRRVRALLLGQWIQPADSDVDPAEWERRVTDLVCELDQPTAAGLPAGHGAPNLGLPLGIAARLDLDRGRLSLG
jgi:muramoyltetrapeptide carboxypeptidase